MFNVGDKIRSTEHVDGIGFKKVVEVTSIDEDGFVLDRKHHLKNLNSFQIWIYKNPPQRASMMRSVGLVPSVLSLNTL